VPSKGGDKAFSGGGWKLGGMRSKDGVREKKGWGVGQKEKKSTIKGKENKSQEEEGPEVIV